MVREILKIRTDNGLGNNNPTFKDIELTEYSAKFPRMGMPSLSASLKWSTPLDDEWTGREYVTLCGERFYICHTPSGKKDNQDSRYNHELEFTSEFAEILGNTYFEDAVPSYSATYDKPCSNSTKFTFYGTIAELVDRLNCAFLKAGVGDSRLETKTDLITTDTVFNDGYCVMLDQLGAGTVYDANKSYEFSFEDKFLWEAITYGYETTEIPFERRGKKIIFGAIPNVVAHKFEYGHDNELLSVYHKNANAKVINRITMLGSSENIPHYYPNETEYGHISIAAKSGNKVLTASNVQIVNMTQLLSRLNADSFAVLGKYDGIDVGNAEVEPYLYSMSFDDGDFGNYILRQEIKHVPNNTHSTFALWHMRVLFRVTKAGVVECRNIKGGVWKQNEAHPTTDVDMIKGITPESLKTVANLPQGITSVDYTSQIEQNEDYVSFGWLGIGEYIFQFSVKIQNKGGGRGEPITSWVRMDSIGIVPATKQKTGYYWDVDGKKYDGVGALGVKLTLNISDTIIGDGFGWEASGRMPFQDHLIPPKYRETLGTERFYNALNDTYIDPDTGNDYVFPNPFVAGAPSEYIHRNEEIKPTIEGITNAVQRKDVNGALMFDDNGNPIYQLLGEIADIAYDVDDNDALKAESTEDGDKNDTLKYEHSFFYIKLNIFNGTYGFDLFAHASQTDAMTIQMRDGSCNGCKFKIQAVKFTDETGLETYKNPIVVRNGKAVGVVSEDGIKESDLDPTQQNTQTHSIWICVQKDASTFGVIMPNKSNNFKPKIGDKFNITNIVMPLAYWYAAEKRLEDDGIRKMADNNEEKFTFDIQASRIFFAENPDVLEQLDEYSVIKVKYNGKTYEQYVNQLTIDCKDSEALPNIGIDLTDTLAVGQSFVDQVAERASSLIANPYTMGGALGGGGGLTTRTADRRYLKKTEADRSKGKIASDVGFEVGEFVSGGSGAILYQDPVTGQTYLEVDKLKARMKAIYAELEVAKESSIGGAFDITPGGGIDISFVEELTDSYRCYFKAKEEDKGADCRFVVGDQARCQESNISNGTSKDASNRYYWRLVTAVNNDESYIELSKTDRDHGEDYDSDAPMAGDTIVQLGNRNDDTRQSAIVLSTVDAFAPCVTLYNGIDNYTLENKSVVEYGVDKTKNPPEPFFHCYGSFFYGPRSKASYLEFIPTKSMLEYKGILHIDSKIGDKTIENYVKEIIPLDEYDYLKQALWQDTIIANGLLLTTAISLGYKDNDGVRHTTAGMSGIYNHPKSIASWWGGPMVDKYYNNSVTPLETPLENPDDYAQALIRMDGSGYLAGGNIRWDEYGAITFGASGITIDLGGGKNDTLQGLGNSIASLTQAMLNLNNHMRPMTKDANGNLTPTTWEAISSGTVLYAVKSSVGFYSEGFISAQGLNPNGSAGGGATQLRMLSDVFIPANPADGQVLTYDTAQGKWVNRTIGTGLSTTELANYLTTNNYVTESWVEGKGYALASDLTAHTGNTIIHITSNERALWNQTATNLSTILGADADGTLNKWNEIVDFLATYTEADTLANLLSNKLNVNGSNGTEDGVSALINKLSVGASTPVDDDYYVSQYANGGTVTTSYHRKPMSALWSYVKGKADARYVTIDTAQTITGVKTFTKEAVFTNGNALRIVQGDYGFIIRHDSNALHFLFTDEGDPYGNFNALRPLYINHTSGRVTMATATVTDELKIGNCTIKYENGGLHFSSGIYSDSFVSARGANPSGGAGGSSFGLMWSWPTTAPSNTTTDALGANLGWELKQAIANLPTTSVNPYAITIQKNGTTLGTYDGSEAKTININDVASAAVLSLHTSNTTIHITAAERTKWNTTANNLADILGSNADAVINKWDEIVAFLDTYTEADTLANLLSNKADKTQLMSYYTKTEADGRYVTLATEQTINGKKTFDDDLYIKGWLILSSPSTDSMIEFNVGGTLKGKMGYVDNMQNSEIFMMNASAGTKLSLTEMDGLCYFDSESWQDVWHTGNDGAGSGLDADLLDGKHASSFLSMDDNGNVGIGTPTPTEKLTVDGDARILSKLAVSPFVNFDDTTSADYNGVYVGIVMDASTSKNTLRFANTSGFHRIFFEKTSASGTVSTSIYYSASSSGTSLAIANLNKVVAATTHYSVKANTANEYFTRDTYGGSSWNSGYGAYNVAVADNDKQTPLMVAYRAGQEPSATGTDRLFAMELLNNGYQLRYAFKGVHKFHMTSAGEFYAATGIWSDGYVSARGDNSSDKRLKTDIRDFKATDIIKALHPVSFKWNAMARSRFKVFDTDEEQYGLIAQEAKLVAPWLVDENMFNDGLWGVKYRKLIPVLLKGQQEQISETDKLKVRIKELEARIAKLEAR